MLIFIKNYLCWKGEGRREEAEGRRQKYKCYQLSLKKTLCLFVGLCVSL